MAKTVHLTKSLAFVATLLVWFPLLAPFLLGLAALAGGGRFLFDFLMPAELFPLILLGAFLHGFARRRAGLSLRPILWEAGGALLGLIVMQGTAVATGLANGAHPPEGWRLTLVLALLCLSYLAILLLARECVVFLRQIYRSPRPPEQIK